MRICLNMIVKNESRVIERCLRSAKPFIHSWAISDTGSTDGTQDIIRRVMGDLPGELIERPWVDFAHNRNEALELAKRHGDFALIIDADEVFEAEPNFAWPPTTAAPGYLLELLFHDMRYRRIAVVKLDEQWEWRGVLHEVLMAPRYPEATYLPGLRIRVFTDGARSQQSQQEKFSKDAETLRQAIEKEPDNARYAFYLAQSLRDALRPQEAIAAYEKRVAMGGWFEEVYYSKLQLGRLKEQVDAPYAEIVAAYLDAYDFRPARADAPAEVARFFRLRERWHLATKFAEIATNLAPNDDVLFVDHAAYQWRARDEWSISAYWSGDFPLSARLCRELLANPALPEHERPRVQKNLEFAESKL
ncbi:MAG TPA: glycosyltransferase [Rudaea sp.]|jgi:hypothetical protein|nr:glycosyltransferase [Rudaea sp.]